MTPRIFKTWKPVYMMAICATAMAAATHAAEMADSTGKVRATRALVLPATITEETIRQEIVQQIIQQAASESPLPAGYKEYTFAAGPHLGASPSYADVAYGYSRTTYSSDGDGYAAVPALDATLCGGNLTHRIIELIFVPASFVYGTPPAATSALYTCEPYGTVTRLVKTGALAATTTITTSAINAYALAGTIGVNTSGATPICKAKGYTDYIPGTVVSTYKGGGCPGGYITQYNNGWLSNTACYNNILTGMQCYK